MTEYDITDYFFKDFKDAIILTLDFVINHINMYVNLIYLQLKKPFI